MNSLGIDIGYASISLALIDAQQNVLRRGYVLHKGDISGTLTTMLLELRKTCYEDCNMVQTAAVTGSGSHYATSTGIAKVNEVAAIIQGVKRIVPEVTSIIEIGAQCAKYITGIAEQNIQVRMNGNCSAGTGSFLEDQVARLNLTLEEYSDYALRAQSVPRIAGRCSVFAKTDIIHHQQEGCPVEDILLGLAYAVVRNYRGTVMRTKRVEPGLVFVGGVAHNMGVQRALNDVLKTTDEITIPTGFDSSGALGAALLAQREHLVCGAAFWTASFALNTGEHITLPALPQLGTFGAADDAAEKHELFTQLNSKGKTAVFLGIDVGSTSTNLVLMNGQKQIVDYRYVRTTGNPAHAVTRGLYELGDVWDEWVHICGVGVTGSGRYMIGTLVGADVVRDEITSQACAAVELDPEVDTIFEIGGQDSKFIRIKDGAVSDFQMNKVCAAGTGSFIEEQANKFDIPIAEFGPLALRSSAPIDLGERCTVFMETSIASELARGATSEDIAAGVCYSVVKNYLNRVVGSKPVGNHILFQGGVAHNEGVIRAFRAITGGNITVPPFFSVSGALGVALLVREEMGLKPDAVSQFKGFRLARQTTPDQAWPKPHHARNFEQKIETMIFAGYNADHLPGRPTVGIPRALFTFGMFPMFNAFFRALDMNVLLSEPTSEETIRLGQEHALEETCYPIKLILGHVAELVEKRVDYIFFPDLYTVDHAGSSSRKNFGCPYMQVAFRMVRIAMELDARGIKLLSPTLAFSLGKEAMGRSFMELGGQLGRSGEAISRALQEGMNAVKRFEVRREASSQHAMQRLHPQEKTFVLVSKIYGVADPVLNMGIPGLLTDMGYNVLPFYDLPEGQVPIAHPNMFWPFGQHILKSARLIHAHPNLYPVLLTHHGCGPDSVLSHYFREIMEDKPYLHVEVDEHSSAVGVVTRVEAFVNSLKNREVVQAEPIAHYLEQCNEQEPFIRTQLPSCAENIVLHIPPLYPYSSIIERQLLCEGYAVQVFPATDSDACVLGRKHTLTNEYFSLMALTGNVLRCATSCCDGRQRHCFVIPQCEGAEVHGQYNRFLRTKLDATGHRDVSIYSPYMEDVLAWPTDPFWSLFYGVLAGDLILNAPRSFRAKRLEDIQRIAEERPLLQRDILSLLKQVQHDWCGKSTGKTLFVTGEQSMLCSDWLNQQVLRGIEQAGHRIIYSPLSESLWLAWRDYVVQNYGAEVQKAKKRLGEIRDVVRMCAHVYGENAPFVTDLDELPCVADRVAGLYSGSAGRYRAARGMVLPPSTAKGVLTLASAYENTAIALNILQRAEKPCLPTLNLTFDGNQNENDQTKIESFIYYL